MNMGPWSIVFWWWSASERTLRSCFVAMEGGLGWRQSATLLSSWYVVASVSWEGCLSLSLSRSLSLSLSLSLSPSPQLEALEYLHSHEYVHADVKGSNLLTGHGAANAHKVYNMSYGLSVLISNTQAYSTPDGDTCVPCDCKAETHYCHGVPYCP